MREPAMDAEKSSVRLTADGADLTVSCASDDVILRAFLREGVAVPYECNVGSCGTCKFELISGEVAEAWLEAPGLTERDRGRKRHLGCQSRPLTDCAVRFLGGDPTEVVGPRASKMTCQLVETRDITHDIREFSFHCETSQAAFLPGQYAVLSLPGVPGVRAYSMSNLSNAVGTWEFIIRRLPGGYGTTALFEHLKVTDPITIDGPFGNAWLRPDQGRHVVCIAGGSGLSPMLSIARGFLADPGYADRRLHFFFGGRRPIDICGEMHLRDAAAGRINIKYHAVISDPDVAVEDWAGPRGFVHTHVLTMLEDVPNFDFYVAGPPPMIDATTGALRAAAVPATQVHYDKFF